MDKALQIILDFVEGRLTAKDFEQKVYHDPALEQLLSDESLKWHETYIKSNPYYFLLDLNYDDLSGVLDAQGAMAFFLEKKGIPFKPDQATYELRNLLLSAQPRWLAVDTAYLQKHVLPDAGSRTGRDLRDWLRTRLKETFRYYKKPPKWIQSPAWPITDNGPMYFLGQIKLENCEHFHDEAAAYLFLDPRTGETRTVIQVF